MPAKTRRRLAVVASSLAATLGIVAGAFVLVGATRDESPPPPTILRAEAARSIGPLRVEPTLPQPAAPPAEPCPDDTPIVQIGEIEIPRIGLVHPIYEGICLRVIDRGPGHWPGTAEPGGYGNSVFAGHRVTNSRPFRNIDQLQLGDEIIVRTGAGSFTYRVTGNEVVTPDGLHIVDQRPGHTLTIFACHPPGSAAYRYVVFADLVDPPPS